MRSAYLQILLHKVSYFFLETKFLQHFIHLLRNFIVAERAYATLVRMVNLAGRGILATLHLHTNLLVRLAERNARKCKTVYILNGKEVIVLAVVDNITLDNDVLQHKVAHLKALTECCSCREDDILQQLQIAVIAQWEIGCE